MEFAFFLAQKLGRTVEELGSMSTAEYVRWFIYYQRKAQREELAAMAKGR